MRTNEGVAVSGAPQVMFGPRRNDGDCTRVNVIVAGHRVGELYKEIGVMEGYSATGGVEAIFGLCPMEGENLTTVKRAIVQEARRVEWSTVDWQEVGIANPLLDFEPDDDSAANSVMLNRIGDMYRQAKQSRRSRRDPVWEMLLQQDAGE